MGIAASDWCWGRGECCFGAGVLMNPLLLQKMDENGVQMMLANTGT